MQQGLLPRGAVMSRKYWLDLFTGTTWEEFLEHGAKISGFRESRKKTAGRISPGDYLLCYLTGISRFVGILEVKSKCYFDTTQIWKDEQFPIRFEVELVEKLDAITAIPVLSLKDELQLFKGLKSRNAWTGFFRGSPAEFSLNDGEIISEAIKRAAKNPVELEYDERKYRRKTKTYESKIGVVTVPEDHDEDLKKAPLEETTHEEIQLLLLKVGSELGLDVWVARNDRNRKHNGINFQDVPNLRRELPRQFDDATNKTIELIDVLWLQGEAIVAAFEVEHTTTIYSGLLRMSDLVSMQPNLKLDLFIVAPDERREKVFYEINRPTFARLKPPLPKICRFIPYMELKKEVEQIGNRMRYMKPEFISEIAESCEPDYT
jgi:predicted RNA-binding protein